jgi:hypothetical protein
MTLAKNRYEVLVEKGIWNAPSAEEEKIMALESTIKRLQNSKRKGQANNQADKKNEKKGSNKSRPQPAWVNEKPKPGEPKTKEVEGKLWHYCENHGRWTHHTTSECRKKGMDKKTGRTMAPPSLKSNPKHNSKAVRFAKAMSTIASEEEEEE